MKEIKNNSNTLNDSLIIEDFKRACESVENHATRSFKMYLLIISGFAVILGLEQQIGLYYIPYILSLFLWITFNFAVTDRRFKYFAQSYLLNTYYNDYTDINYENYFRNYCNPDDNKEPTIYGRLKKIHSMIHPLLVIYLFGLYISYKFACNYVKDTCGLPIWLILYVLGLLLLHSLIIRKLFVLYKNDFEKTIEIVEGIHKKHYKKENSSE